MAKYDFLRGIGVFSGPFTYCERNFANRFTFHARKGVVQKRFFLGNTGDRITSV
jgi:hypothetical protein